MEVLGVWGLKDMFIFLFFFFKFIGIFLNWFCRLVMIMDWLIWKLTFFGIGDEILVKKVGLFCMSISWFIC